MEGKGLLFKIYADIDVFDIELNTKDVDEFVRTVKILEPTFGGVNLEDISAPECFEIEERLKAELNIPVMHDDQHGTAIISSAALLNALELVEKDISKVQIIINGAGASAISCTRLYHSLGADKKNIFMFDSKGLIHPSRTNLDGKKIEFANDNMSPETTLAEALLGLMYLLVCRKVIFLVKIWSNQWLRIVLFLQWQIQLQKSRMKRQLPLVKILSWLPDARIIQIKSIMYLDFLTYLEEHWMSVRK